MVVPSLDDPGYTYGGRLALVWTRDHAVARWRTATILRHRGCRGRGDFRHFSLQGTEKTQPASAALPTGTALLVESAAAGQVLVSIGTYNDGFLGGAGGELLLSLPGSSTVLSGDQHCGFPHRAGNALPERRAGGDGFGSGAWMRLDYHFRFAWMGLNLDMLVERGTFRRLNRA